MAKRYPKLKYHLVCDDIRQEVGNKGSLIGVYRTSNISLPIPFVIPKLCFHLVFSHMIPTNNFQIQIIDPDNERIVETPPRPIEIPKEKKFQTYVMELMFMGIKISKEGTYRLVSIFGKEDNAKQEVKIEIKKIA